MRKRDAVDAFHQRSNEADEEPLLTPVQTAELLGVAVDTLRSWRAKRQAQPAWTRIGRMVRYYPASVREFRDRGRVTAAP